MAKTYVTALGDTWDIIAYKMYGNERQMSALIAANPEHRETVIFPADVVLAVPTLPTTVIPVSVPPWKRGLD